MAVTCYAIALGSNRCHGRHGRPAGVIRAAAAALDDAGMKVTALSPILRTEALGPAGREFANAVALVESALAPPEILAAVKAIEHAFGRRRGRRWGPRVLDLDVVLWSGGQWHGGRSLSIPHSQLAARAFVLQPLATIASDWRDPRTGRSVRQLLGRLTRRRPVDRGASPT